MLVIVFRTVLFSFVVSFLHFISLWDVGQVCHVWRLEDNFTGVGSPLPICQSRGLNSGLQAWWQMFYLRNHLMSLLTLFYFSFLLVYSFILHIWVFACKCVCAWCLRKFEEGSRSPEAEVTKWVLVIELGSSVRAASTFNLWAISSSLIVSFETTISYSDWLWMSDCLFPQPPGYVEVQAGPPYLV